MCICLLDGFINDDCYFQQAWWIRKQYLHVQSDWLTLVYIILHVFWLMKMNMLFDSTVHYFRQFWTTVYIIISLSLFAIIIKPVAWNGWIMNMCVHISMFIYLQCLYEICTVNRNKERLNLLSLTLNFKSFRCKYFLLIFCDFSYSSEYKWRSTSQCGFKD